MYWETDKKWMMNWVFRRVQKETDPKILTQIVLTAPSDSLRQAALRKLTNWWDLVGILNAPVDPSIKQQALRQIRPEGKFMELLMSGKLTDSEIERAVLEKTGGEEDIYSYVMSHSYQAANAIKYLNDEKHLRAIVTDSRVTRRVYPDEARKAALEKITGQDALRSVTRMGIYRSADTAEGALDRDLIVKAAQRLTGEEDLLWLLNWYSEDDRICTGVIGALTDPILLKSIAENTKGKAKMLASEKLEGRSALERVANDKHSSMENRLIAAAKIMKKYGDDSLLRELQKLGEETVNGHLLYTTISKAWEQTEQICLRCAKTGGVETDSESTRHYGCNFRSEPCRGFDTETLK